jgi:hypothetical protein
MPPPPHPNITRLVEAGVTVGRLTPKRQEILASLTRTEIDMIVKVNRRLVNKGLVSKGDTNGYVVF